MGVSIPGVTGLLNQPTGQIINGSLNFEGGNNQALKRTPTTAGNRRTWTYSCWVKKQNDNRSTFFSAGTTSSDTGFSDFGLGTQKRLRFSGWNTNWRTSLERLRDYNQFYHFVVAFDATQSTAADRVKLYKNGVQITDFNVYNDPSDVDYAVNDTVIHYIGGIDGGGGENLTFTDFSMTQVYFIDGQQLGPENFGFTDPLTNTWRPKKYTGGFNNYTLTAPTYNSGQGSDVTTTEFDKMVDGDLSTYGQGNGASGTNRFIGFSLPAAAYPSINVKIKNTTNSALDFIVQPSVTGQGLISGGNFASNNNNNGTVNVPANTTLEDTFSFPSGYEGFGRIYLNNSGNAADAWEIYDFGGTKVTTNSFYLPMDGNSPIGQDKSGQGNDWTPVNFGCSNSVDKATGALPILNTVSGGHYATVGVRTDAYASNLVLAVPFVGNTDDVSHLVNSSQSQKADTNNGSTANIESNFYGGSRDFDGSNDTCSFASVGACGSGDWTVEFWLYSESSSQDNVYRRIVSTGQNSTSAIQIGHIGEGAKNNGYITYTHSDNSVYAVNTTNVMNRWAHIAVVRESGSVNVYTDGIKGTTADSDANDKTGTTWYVSGYGGSSSSGRFNGKIQDLRVYPGIAKYTSNFVPASTNPDILPDTPSGVSGSSKLTKITDGAVSFDGTGDDLHIADSADFEFGTGDFTIECFAYHTEDSDDHLISKYGSSNANRSWRLVSDGNQKIIFYWYYSTDSSLNITSAAGKFSLNRWHHIVAQRTSGDIYLFVDGELVGSNTSSGAAAEFNDNSTAVAIAGDLNGSSQDFPGFISNVRIVKGTGVYSTLGFTPPTAPLTNVTNTKLLCCQSNTQTGAASVTPVTGNTGYTGTSQSITLNQANLNVNNPIVANVVDGDTSTSANIREVGSFIELIFPQQQNGELQVNVANGNDSNDDNIRVFIDGVEGTSFDVSSQQWYTIHTGNFTTVKLEAGGPTTGWIYGFRIGTSGDTIISNSLAPIGDAASTTFNPFNTDINTVRGQETGYATWNPLSLRLNQGTLTDGNLKLSASGNHYIEAKSNFDASRVDNYSELTITEASGSDSFAFGIAASNDAWVISGVGTYLVYRESGAIIRYPGNTTVATVSSYTAGDVLGMAIDSTNVKFYKNGILQGTYAHGYSKDYFVTALNVPNTASSSMTANFGQKPFKFPPPDGFQPLNDANTRPTTVIARPDQYVGVTTYKGNNTVGRIIDIGRNADLVWVKKRTAENHILVDTVRGANNFLMSDSTNTANTSGGPITGIGATVYNGFIVDNNGYVNGNNSDYVCWNWKAGGDKNTFNVDDVGYATTTAAGLTAGDVTPTGASVGTKQGFSIIRWTAPTWNGSPQQVPHGLTQSPSFIITKVIDDTASWYCYHKDLDASNPENYYLTLNNAQNRNTLANGWGTNPPDNTTFGDRQIGWSDGKDVIAYIWHDVPGLQKFGKYTGVNDSNGPYLDLGFRPAVIIFKNISSGSTEWVILDNKRDGYNGGNNILFPSTADQENVTQYGDFLSNGWKFNINSSYVNSTDTFIYAAWAETPRINLYGGQANAR